MRLHPEILGNAQKFVQEKLGTANPKPVFFVFHGGSGSEKADITLAVQSGVVKINIDSDTQYAYWDGVRAFEAKNHGYLQGQIGNPDGPTKPNKKYYDPRVWIREAEKAMVTRLQETFVDINCVNRA